MIVRQGGKGKFEITLEPSDLKLLLFVGEIRGEGHGSTMFVSLNGSTHFKNEWTALRAKCRS